jgi:beta-N-acetylhexosaminidase
MMPPASATPTGDPAARAARLLRTLSDEDLVGQVLMPYAYGSHATQVDQASAAANQRLAGVHTPAELIARFRPAGLILVGFTAQDPTGATNPAANVQHPAQVRELTAGLQQAAAGLPGGAPLLIGTDQEYGVVTRIREGVTLLPSAMAFGAAARPDLTERAWAAAGTELAAMGITVDFAPVADTLGPAGSTVIGSRSFGSVAAANSVQVAAAVRGLRSAGVAAALKHFPGHGHTTADSHTELPSVTLSEKEWRAQDRPPFAAGVQAGADLVMSGHLNVPALDQGMPATFSRTVMTDLLRAELRFTGVAVTDAMTMAPAKKWPAGEAAVRALNAGNDLVLMPPDLAGARDGLLAALRNGTLPRARLIEAATRVLTLRFRSGARAQPPLTVVQSSRHQRVAAEVAAASITVLRGPCSGPLADGPITVTASGGREVARVTLVKALQAAGVRVQSAGGKIVHLVGFGDRLTDLSLNAHVTVGMDQPGLLAGARSPVLVATYSASAASLSALAGVIAGKVRAPGRSPVTVAGLPLSACVK